VVVRFFSFIERELGLEVIYRCDRLVLEKNERIISVPSRQSRYNQINVL